MGSYSIDLAKLNLSDGKSLTQTFDASNNLTCRKDEESRVTRYSYNATNQRISETLGLAGDCANAVPTAETRTTAYEYLSPTLSLPTRILSPSVNAGQQKQTVITYQNNNPVTVTQSGFTPTGTAISRTVSMQYNAAGQVIQIDGARTDVADITTLAYYTCTTGAGCGQLQSVTNAFGHVTTYDTYDANGHLTQMTDANGLKTSYTYDPRGRVKTVTQIPPVGAIRTTRYTYDAAGQLIQTILPDGMTLTYTYDAARSEE